MRLSKRRLQRPSLPCLGCSNVFTWLYIGFFCCWYSFFKICKNNILKVIFIIIFHFLFLSLNRAPQLYKLGALQNVELKLKDLTVFLKLIGVIEEGEYCEFYLGL